MANLVLMVRKATRGQPDQLDQVDLMEMLEIGELLDSEDLLACQDLQDPWVALEPTEILGKTATQEHRATQDVVAFLARTAKMEKTVNQVQMDPLALEDLPEIRVTVVNQDSKVQSGHLAR